MRPDTEIQKNVQEELKWEAVINAVKPTEIGVIVKNGVVTLLGTVDSYDKKTCAEEAAGRVSGVRAIANDIEVKVPDVFTRNDGELAEAILNILKWNGPVPEERIKLKVSDGWVTLEGDVEWRYQKKAAEKAIENVIGVKGVINDLRVAGSSPTPGDIKDKIHLAFRRNHFLDDNKIKVEIDHSTAILKGSVRSLAERREAENATWSAPGITNVKNELVVEHSEIYA